MKYRTIVADPPWDHSDGNPSSLKEGWVRRPLPYSVMTLGQIADIPVKDLADRNCRLFLWATNRYLPFAFSILSLWGFTYRQTLAWGKPDAYTGSVAGNGEFCLVGTRGSPPVLERMPSAVVITVAGNHSAKPDCWMDWFEIVSPGPYLELFARRQRLGWDTWGNEALEHVQL